MPEYVIEREIPGAGAMTQAQLDETSRASMNVLEELGPQIKWIRSFVTDDKIYCIYFAPDESLIREHARRLGVPANRISAVRALMGPLAA